MMVPVPGILALSVTGTVVHTVLWFPDPAVSLGFSKMAAKFVLFKWILPPFVLIDIIVV